MKYLSALFLLLIVPFTASAAILQADEELSITIPIFDDLYAAGGYVNVQENVEGDLIIAGGDIVISGDVDQDIMAAGGDIALQGIIEDDLRVAGGNITLSGTVGDDLIAFGAKIILLPESVVIGDARIYGANIVINGTTNGDLFVQGDTVRIFGIIDGNIDVQAQSLMFDAKVGGNAQLAARTLKVEETAVITGNLNYWTSDEIDQWEKAQIGGEIIFDEALAMTKIKAIPNTLTAVIIGMFGYSLFASAFIILCAILLTKTYFKDAAKRLYKYPGMSIWHGFLYVIVTPIIAFLFFLTLIGIPIGLLILITYLITLFFIKSLSSILFAQWISIHLHKQWGNAMIFAISIIILFIWKILVFVPFIGTLVSTIAILAGFGALTYTEWEKWKKIR